MSKNTKIIAIVGGVLIVAGLGYLLFTGGLFTKATPPKRAAASKGLTEASRCIGLCQMNKTGGLIESKSCSKKYGEDCRKTVATACKDANFAKANAAGCKSWSKSEEKDDD